MQTSSRKAIVFGATGVVGRELVSQLNELGVTVYAVVRRPSDIFSESVHQIVIANQRELSHSSIPFAGSDVYVAIGTTKAKTPNKDVYFGIDYGIPVAVATKASEEKARSLHVVSAMGANPDSFIFYNATKGKMERDVASAFNEAYFYRPSLIMGERDESRGGEALAKSIFKVVNAILPKKMKGVYPQQIAQKMIRNTGDLSDQHVFTSDEFHEK
ncbi:NAD(P)H-binding protein [Phaeocystidibacter marisrubri]|uniref:NAD(P)H-binding protein n=1 Tax=Phaeocystidibacter marisrubri TaxID=1577780 RepID=A0A6L3ZI85_9FLAO|nr:NAD(P)H-binding protein [Phaeocystidibacter marisrubri]KAB2817702.1 NAD(P)H-binding protein [Phaeocystidibacter marisrubri]GGH74021.1 hypothetical protein GCM10011318_19570 [Phaeocystidibacter marisrubri]